MSGQELERDADLVGGTDVEPAVAVHTPAGGGRGPRGWRSRLRSILLWALCVVLTLALVASGLVVWSVRRSFPEYGGTITLPGLEAPVTVSRDSYGIPQVYASSEADLFRAQGYVHAQDRFWEMDFRRHLTSGRLSELFGASLVPDDAFLRTMGWRRVAAQEWQIISPQARSYLQAYADGVNAWIADHGGSKASGAKSLEYTVLGLRNSGYSVEPWDPIDSLAWLKAMAWDLRSNMRAEIDRAALLAHGLSRDQIEQLYPTYPFARNRPIVEGGAVVDGAFDAGARPATATAVPASYSNPGGTFASQGQVGTASLLGAMRSLPNLLGVDTTSIGSNSWVVSGALTASGKPLLANDPHLAASMPGIWYQIGLHCSCPYNVQGFSLSGIPGVVIGHNARVAWGMTNVGADVTDLYLEMVDGERYFDGTAWHALASRQEVIEVAGGAPVAITVRATKHGPLLSDQSPELLEIAAKPPVNVSASTSYAVALRWTALDPGRTIDALFALNKAANWTDFRAAAALFDVPAQNIVYADVDGNIGYQAPGRIPIRTKGDGQWPAPGWDPAYDWEAYIPFAELPHVLNPPTGVIVTANQAVIGPQYPYTITGDWSYGYRSQRVIELIAERAAHGKLDVEDMRQMQFDNRNGFAAVLVPVLLATPLSGNAAETVVAEARDLLKDWDFQQPASLPARTSAAAAFYNATWRHLLLRTFDELPAGRKPGGGERWWEVVRSLLVTPTSPWWDDSTTETIESMSDVLTAAMNDAAAELTTRLGADPAMWRWGDLHILTLASDTFGESGIAVINWLFNRGPVQAAGGSGLVNATGWSADKGYDVDFVPSMRMIVDLSDLDGSRWIQLSGNSGHAFHANYADQTELWRTGRDTSMHWTRPSIEAAVKHVLTFEPAGAR